MLAERMESMTEAILFPETFTVFSPHSLPFLWIVSSHPNRTKLPRLHRAEREFFDRIEA